MILKNIFSCLITDFPIAYLEKFNEIDNLNKSINNLKKKINIYNDIVCF